MVKLNSCYVGFSDFFLLSLSVQQHNRRSSNLNSKLVVSCDRLWPSSNIGFLFGSQNHVFFIINPEKKWMLTCVTRVVVIWLSISISETQTQSWCVIDIAENFIWKQPSTFLAPGKYSTMSKMCFNQTYGEPVVQVRYTGCPLKNVPIDKESINDS